MSPWVRATPAYSPASEPVLRHQGHSMDTASPRFLITDSLHRQELLVVRKNLGTAPSRSWGCLLRGTCCAALQDVSPSRENPGGHGHREGLWDPLTAFFSPWPGLFQHSCLPCLSLTSSMPWPGRCQPHLHAYLCLKAPGGFPQHKTERADSVAQEARPRISGSWVWPGHQPPVEPLSAAPPCTAPHCL